MIRHNFISNAAQIVAAILLCPVAIFASEMRVSADRSLATSIPGVSPRAVQLQIETENGDIQYSATDEPGISVEAHVVVSGREMETCEALADQVKIRIEEVGETIQIVTQKPKKFGYGFSVNFVVRSPRRLGVKAETVNGEVLVLGAEGPTALESVNGAVKAVETKGSIEASTTNGSIILMQVVSNRIEASTVNGRVECSCRGKAPGSIDVSTVNGSIDIRLPSRVDARLSAQTVNGGVQVDLGSGKVASKSRGGVELSVGEGSANYEISSVNGAISIAAARAD